MQNCRRLCRHIRIACVWVISAIGSASAQSETPSTAHGPAASHHHHMHLAAVKQESYNKSSHAYKLPRVDVMTFNGQSISLGDLLDQAGPVMLNFIFTSCSAICPVMTATFAQVQRELGAESHKLRLVSISIDPDYDTPATLKRYAEKFNAGPNWHFLTGARDDIVEIQKAFEAYRGNKMNHVPLTFIRSSFSDQWERIEGFASADDLVREYVRLDSQ